MNRFATVALYFFVYAISSYLLSLFYKIKRSFRVKDCAISTIVGCIMLVLTIIPIALIYGMRSDAVGYDTPDVVRGYYRTGKGSYVALTGSFSYLYQALRYLVYISTNGSRIAMLFIIAALSILLIEFGYDRLLDEKKDVPWALFLFLLYLGPVMMDQSRQFIAVGFFVIAAAYLIRDDRIRFLQNLIVGTFFHESTLIALLLLAIKRRHISKLAARGILFVGTVLAVITMRYIVQIVYLVLPAKFEYIKEQAHEGISGLGWVVDVLPMLYTIILIALFSEKWTNEKHFEIYEFAVYSILVFRLMGYYSFFIMRLYYYGAALCPVAGLKAIRYSNKMNKTLLRCGLMTIYLIRYIAAFYILNLNGVVPYSFIE